MKTLIIYLDESMNCKQVITPNEKFDGNYRELAYCLTNGSYFSYKVI